LNGALSLVSHPIKHWRCAANSECLGMTGGVPAVPLGLIQRLNRRWRRQRKPDLPL
jgi:hypothetical protein